MNKVLGLKLVLGLVKTSIRLRKYTYGIGIQNGIGIGEIKY